MQRGRIVRIVGTKVAIALTLSVSANFSRTPVEYRTLGPLEGLEAGAPVTLAGQVIGTVLAVHRRGDAAAFHVRYVRRAERLPGSRTVRVLRMGLDDSIVLQFSLEPRPACSPATRSFALGGWLTVGPSPAIEPPPRPRVAESVPPPLYQLLPLPPPAPPRIARLPWRA